MTAAGTATSAAAPGFSEVFTKQVSAKKFFSAKQLFSAKNFLALSICLAEKVFSALTTILALMKFRQM